MSGNNRAIGAAIDLARHEQPSSARARLLRTALSGSAMLAMAGVAAPAWAQSGACGTATDGTVTCTPDGNPYSDGIVYRGSQDLTVLLAPGVVVERTTGGPAVSVVASGNASGAVRTADDVAITSSGNGIVVETFRTAGGDATIDNGANVIAGRSGLLADADGDVIIINRGNIVVGDSLEARRGIGAFSANGNVAVQNSGDIDVTSPSFSAVGISAFTDLSGGRLEVTNSGAINTVRTGSSNIPFGSFGILAQVFGSDSQLLVTNSGPISTTVTGSGSALGIATFIGGNGGGLVQITNTGAIDAVNAGSFAAVGINVIGRAGTTSDAAITSGGPISAESSGLAVGVRTSVGGDASINATGPLDVTGAQAFGVLATSESEAGGGNITIVASDINVASNIEAGSGAGILAFTGSGNIAITSGTITASGSGVLGINAFTTTGDLTIDSGTITTASGDGIDAETESGALNITSGSITIGEGGVGIDASSVDGSITITSGSIATRGSGAEGINAESVSGDITITSGSITAEDSNGILAESETGNVTINSTDVSTTGDDASGILVQTAGDVTLTSGSVQTDGEGSSGIDAFSSEGDVTVTNTGDITTEGDFSFGIIAEAAAGAVSVTNNGSVTTSGFLSDGIVALGATGATVAGRGTVTTTGENAFGVLAFSDTGDVSVTTGAISTSGDDSLGIFALSNEGTTIVDATSVSTQGSDAIGIFAASATEVTVTAGTVTTSGTDSSGIVALATGPVTVTAQNVAVSGTGGNAIFAEGLDAVTVTSGNASSVDQAAIVANSDEGAVTVTITGATTSAQADAVSIEAATTATVNVRAGGSVRGGQDGIRVTAPDGTTITNAGNISAVNGAAIRVVGGPASITNSGTITGGIILTGNNDVLNNSGTINNTAGIQFGAGNDTLTNSGTVNAVALTDFGSGNDTLNNSGTFNSAANISFGDGNDSVTNSGTFNAGSNLDFGAGTDTFTNSGLLRVTSQAVTFAGLETFNNSGLIDLRNGRTGDTLTLPGTFTGSGNSQLGLDVTFGNPGASDRLIVGNAQGSTGVLLNPLGGQLLLGNGPVLVQASAASAPGAFTLANGPVQAGLIQGEIVYNPTTFSYSLTGTPSDVAFRTTAFVEAARSLWHKSAEAWSAQMREGRDTMMTGVEGEPGGRLWIQGYASQFDRGIGGDFTAFGTTRNVDLGYGQDFFGVQGGFDFGGAIGNQGGFAFGVTGGYVDSRVNFRGAGDDLELSAANVGAYARFAAGPFFINGLAKYDMLVDASARSLTGGFDAEVDGEAYGGMVEAGFRLGSNRLFVEPMASIAYVRSELDGLEIQGATLDFDDDDGLRGKAGARVGAALPIGNGATALLYGGAHYVHEFRGEDSVRLTSGANAIDLEGRRMGDYVEGMVGLNIAGPGPLSGFFEANGSIDDDRDGLGVRTGLRIRF